MSIFNNSLFAIPTMFNGENYYTWAVVVKFYLRSQGLWNAVNSEADPPPLREIPTIAQIKALEEEKLNKDKAITCLHSGQTYQNFTKVTDLETPKQVYGMRSKMNLMAVTGLHLLDSSHRR